MKHNVLITGGSRGIGKAIGYELVNSQHNVLLVAKNKDNLAEAQNEIFEKTKCEPQVFQCDLENKEEIASLYQYCTKYFNPDILVLNAGIYIEGNLTDSDPNDFRKLLEINLISAFNVVETFISSLREQKKARIIIIGSTTSIDAFISGAMYGVSKWAIKGYAHNLRKELKNDRIGVTLITPGGTLTDIWADDDVEENRLLQPSDIGKIVDLVLKLSNQSVIEDIIIRPMLGDMHDL